MSNTEEKSLNDVYPEFYFKLIDGLEIKNIQELADALEEMSDDVFYYHVNQEKNDFGNWVRDVFKQEKLAEDMVKSGSRLETAIQVLKFMVKELK